MTKTILIAVSDGFSGYGDFLFALKLAAGLREKYKKLLPHGADVPVFKIITQETGKKKIEELRGVEEYGLEVLTPKELKEKIQHSALDVSKVIEGPVFQSLLLNTDLMYQIDNILPDRSRVPLVMIPEYSIISDMERKKRIREKLLRARSSKSWLTP